jgi:triacylglycerol lipase
MRCFVESGLIVLGLLTFACGTSPGHVAPDVSPTPDASSVPDADSHVPCPVDDGRLVTAPEGEYVAQGAVVSGTRAHCEGVRHAIAGAGGSTLRVGLVLWTAESTATLRVLGLPNVDLAEHAGIRAGGSVLVELPRSGEYLLRLDPDDFEAEANAYEVSVACVAGCDLEYTRYPLFLMHGFAGTDAYLPSLDYFYHVVDTLTAAGFLAYAPAVDAFNTIQDRAMEWQAHLDELVSFGLARRFNLIAHSQGGLDSRFLISILEDPRPASLVTISTPHYGSAVGDLVTGILDPLQFESSLVNDVFDAMSTFLGFGGTDLSNQMNDLTRDSAVLFNSYVRDVPGVYYASWAGHSCGMLDWGCQDDWNGEIIEPFLAPTFRLLDLEEGANDGMVSVTSAVWGEFMGEFPGDHFDEVGQVADTNNPAWNHLEFYLSEARRLAALGY